MCPVKYAGECRPISQAAERADSLASGTITSRDLGFVSTFLSACYLCPPSLSSALSVLHFCFFTFLFFHFPVLPLSPLLLLQLSQNNYNPSWHVCTSIVYLHAHRHVYVFPCTVCDFICICESVCVPICALCGGSVPVEQCNDSCLLALRHLYMHQCLQTRHVCLPFLNGFTQRQQSRLSWDTQ